VKHLGTLFWTALLVGSLGCLAAGFASARGLHAQTIAQLTAAARPKAPPPPPQVRELTRRLIGAQSVVVADDDAPPVEDVVAERFGDWAPRFEGAAFASHPRLAVIVADCGRALPLDSKFAALPAALTLAVDPTGAQSEQLVRMLGVRRVLLALPNALFSNPSRDALARLAARYGALHAEGALSPLSGDIDGSQARRVVAELPRSSVVVDGMAQGTATVYRYAHARGLQSVTRDIVIDAYAGTNYAAFMLKQAATLALRSGVAIAVGRSRPETLAAIEATLPMLERDGIEVVPIESLGRRTMTRR